MDTSQTVGSVPNKMNSYTKYVETPLLDRKHLHWAEIPLLLNFYAVFPLWATVELRLLHFSVPHLFHWEPQWNVDLIKHWYQIILFRQIYPNHGTAWEVCFAVTCSQKWSLLTLLQNLIMATQTSSIHHTINDDYPLSKFIILSSAEYEGFFSIVKFS